MALTLSPALRGSLLAAAGVVVLSPDSLLIRLVDTDSWTLLFWRGSISALVLGAIAFFSGRKTFFSRLRRLGFDGLMVAICFTGSVFCFVAAVRLTNVASALVIIAANPFLTAAMSAVILKERPAGYTWGAMIVGLVGVGVVTLDDSGSATLVGAVAAMGCAVCVATGFVMLRRAGAKDMNASFALSGVMTAIVALPFADVGAGLNGYDPLWLLLLGAVVVPGSYVLVGRAAHYLSAPEVSLFMLLETAIGPLWVWLVLEEAPGIIALFGGAMVVGALFVNSALTIRRERRRRAA